ncbi:MAG: hypothetical protein PW843_18780 [Azospirillaceae bacterium]|nr:hypothetical protein [Azospirillaceae bacterium]
MPLEIKDWISAAAIFASAIVASVGWVMAARKDRKHHIFQKRLERRLSMLDDVIQAVVPLMNYRVPFEQDKDLPEKLAKARLSVQLYGYMAERTRYEALVEALESADWPKTKDALNELVPIIRRNLREEMGYSYSDFE